YPVFFGGDHERHYRTHGVTDQIHLVHTEVVQQLHHVDGHPWLPVPLGVDRLLGVAVAACVQGDHRTTRFTQCRHHARLFPVERGARHEPVMEEDRDALAFPHPVTDLDSVGALKDSHDFVGVLPPHPHGCWKVLIDVVGAIRLL